jgi:hypothetical protein
MKSLSLSDFKFEQVGHGFNSEIQQPLLIVTFTLIPFANRNIGINLARLFKMSGRRGRNNGRGGCGGGGANRGGRIGGRGQNYTGSANAAKRGMCSNIVTNVFEYGQSLQQIKCAPHGKILYSMLAPTMDKTLTTNCRTRFGFFLMSL